MSAGGATSSEVIENPPEVRAARFGAVTVALAGILGGLVGTAGTIYVSNIQIAAEDERSRAAFLRTQQQNTYAAFIADSNLMNDSAAEFYVQALESPRLDPDDEEFPAAWAAAEESKQRMQEAHRELSDSWSAVQLIGSSATAEEADRLVRAQQHLMGDLISASRSFDDSPPIEATERLLRNAQLERNRLVREFVDAARKDLGTD